MVIILNGNLSQRHNGLGRTLGVASVTREPCHARFNDNCLSGIRIFDASCTQNRQCCRYVLVGKLGIRGIVGITLGIASILLTRQARRDRNLRVVLRLRDLQVLGCDNGAVARLKQAPVLTGHRVIARQINRHDAQVGRIGRCLVVAPGKVAVGIEISLLERVHVGRNGIGVLAIQNGGSVAGLSLLHKGKLSIELVLVLRGNRKIEGLACRDLGVGLIGHREGNLGVCSLGSGQRLVDRALVTVERDFIGARRVLNLVVLAVDIERARARHLQVGGQAILVGNRIGAEVLDVVVGKGRIDLLLQRLLVGGDLLGIALDGHDKVMRAGKLDVAARNRNLGGQRHVSIARCARNLTCLIFPAITRNKQALGVGACPFNREFLCGTRLVRKRDILGHAIGGLTRRIANLQGFGSTVKKVLQLSLVPSNLYRLVGLVRLSLAIARQLKHHIGVTQTVDVETGVVVGIDVEERHIAVGLILSVGDADRGLGILCLKEHAALRDLDVDIGKSQIGKLRLQRVIDVAALGAVINSDLLIGIVELLDCSLERARGDNLVGGDELDRRATARGDSLQILARGRSRDRRLSARHIGQQRPVGRGSLRVVRRIPGNSRLSGHVNAVGG